MKERTENIYGETKRLSRSLKPLTLPQAEWILGQEQGRCRKEYAKTGKLVSRCEYFAIVTCVERWQVVRYFLVSCSYTEKRKDRFQYDYIQEVCHRWSCEENGRIQLVNYERGYAMFWYNNRHPYSLNSHYTDWKEDRARTRINLGDEEIYPVRRFAPFVTEKGLERYIARVDPFTIRNLYNSRSLASISHKLPATKDLDKSEVYESRRTCPPYLETIYKQGNAELLRLALGTDAKLVRKYWHAILIARRHRYEIGNLSAWLDYIQECNRAGLDTHNPKYVCPEDMTAMLVKVTQISNAQRRKRRTEADARKAKAEAEKNRKEIEKYEPIYAKERGKYLSMVIKTKNLEIRPLQSVGEFLEEGTHMHHCVFTNRYYRPENHSLVMSAKDKEGNRVETIEVDLNTYKIVQSRGVCNSSTKWHDSIVKAVTGNMNRIRALA